MLFVAEGEVFQIKKSSHSKRIVKQLKKESLKDKSDDSASVKFEVSFGTDQVCGCFCLNSMAVKLTTLVNTLRN